MGSGMMQCAHVARVIAEAADQRYALGRNDCMTLIASLVRGGGHPPLRVHAVEAALGRYQGISYFAAMRRAVSVHGSIGAAMMAELVDGAGLAPASGVPGPGDVLLFEGTLDGADGLRRDTREEGTLEVVIDDLGAWWSWTLDGLRRTEEVFTAMGVAATGGMQCLSR